MAKRARRRYRHNVAAEVRVRDGKRFTVYHARVMVGGIVKTRTVRSRALAERWLEGQEANRAGFADPTPRGPATLGQALQAHIDRRRHLGRAADTLRDLEQIKAKALELFSEDHPLELTQAELDHYVDRRRRQGAGDRRILRELAQVRSAVRNTAGPSAAQWKLPDLRPTLSPRHLPTDRELATVLEHIGRQDHYRALLLGLLTGMRATDVLRVTWSALRFDPHRWAELKPHERVLELNMGKRRGAPNLVYVTSTLAGALVNPGEPDEPIIGLTESALRCALQRRTTKLKKHELLPRVWSGVGHLRHLAATWLAEAGLRDDQVGLILGHTPATVTRRHYVAHSNLELRRQAAELLEARLLGALFPDELAALALPQETADHDDQVDDQVAPAEKLRAIPVN